MIRINTQYRQWFVTNIYYVVLYVSFHHHHLTSKGISSPMVFIIKDIRCTPNIYYSFDIPPIILVKILYIYPDLVSTPVSQLIVQHTPLSVTSINCGFVHASIFFHLPSLHVIYQTDHIYLYK